MESSLFESSLLESTFLPWGVTSVLDAGGYEVGGRLRSYGSIMTT